MNRRKFSRAEARRLRAEGLTFEQIGARLGVSAVAAFYAVKRRNREDIKEEMSARELDDYKAYVKSGIRAADALDMIKQRRETRATESRAVWRANGHVCQEINDKGEVRS